MAPFWELVGTLEPGELVGSPFPQVRPRWNSLRRGTRPTTWAGWTDDLVGKPKLLARGSADARPCSSAWRKR